MIQLAALTASSTLLYLLRLAGMRTSNCVWVGFHETILFLVEKKRRDDIHIFPLFRLLKGDPVPKNGVQSVAALTVGRWRRHAKNARLIETPRIEISLSGLVGNVVPRSILIVPLHFPRCLPDRAASFLLFAESTPLTYYATLHGNED